MLPVNYSEKNIITHQSVKAINQLILDGKFKNRTDFCSWCGYNKSFYGKLSKGLMSFPLPILYKLVIAFKLNPDYFFPSSTNKVPELYQK